MPAYLSSHLRAPRVQLVVAAALFLGGALLITWPLAAHLGSWTYISPGRPLGDYQGTLAWLREVAQGPHIPFLPGELMDFNAPRGQPIQWVLNIATFPRTLTLWVLAMIFGATGAVNLFVLLGFTATGIATFLLVRRITGSWAIGLIIGWAFAFCPFAVAQGEHPDSVHGWPFVILVWRWLELVERPTLRNGAYAGLGTVLALAWNPYYVLLGGILFAGLLVATLVMRRRGLVAVGLKPLAAAVGVILVFVAAIGVFSLVQTDGAVVRPNTIADVIDNSARPLNYLAPAGSNPITGGLTRPALERRGWYPGAERAIYPGLSVIALALLAGGLALRRRLERRATIVVAGCATAAALAAVTSGPPEVEFAGLTIPLPSKAIFSVTEIWRIYLRLGHVVALTLCLLAAVGAAWLVRRAGSRAPAVLAAIALIVTLDLWSQFSPRTTSFPHPAIYEQLRALPDGIVAEYPLRPTEHAGDYRDIYNQQFHGKPMINGYPSHGDDEDRALALADLSHPTVASRLATAGVRYVVVEKHPDPVRVPPVGTPGPAFEKLSEDDYGTLYAVHARPAPFVWTRSGFDVRVQGPGGASRWMNAPAAEMVVRPGCEHCVGTLTVYVSSYARDRVVRAIDARDKVLGEVTAPPGRAATMRLALRFDRETVIRFEATPGPEPMAPPEARSVAADVGPVFWTAQGREREATTW